MNWVYRNYKRIIFWVIAWTLAAYLFFIIRTVGTQGEVAGNFLTDSPFFYNILPLTLSGILLALLFIIMEAVTNQPRIRKRSFRWIIVIKLISFAVMSYLVVLLSMILGRIGNTEGLSLLRPREVFLTPAYQVILLYITLVGGLFSFLELIDRKLGPDTLFYLIVGKYYHPKQEQRIFLFLDMESSTTIAEELGHIRYSQLLQDCFADLTQVVLDTEANIYQYVGDEAILQWLPEKGLRENRCIKAFFLYEAILQERAGYYQSQYGLLPKFKGGMHMGDITRAEVGVIKQELAFHGDTINTTARIQSLCSKLEKDFLISEAVLSSIAPDKAFKIEPAGQEQLKGKKKMVSLSSVQRSD